MCGGDSFDCKVNALSGSCRHREAFVKIPTDWNFVHLEAARGHLDECAAISCLLTSLSLGISISLYSLLICGWPSLPVASTTNSRGDSIYHGSTSYSLPYYALCSSLPQRSLISLLMASLGSDFLLGTMASIS